MSHTFSNIVTENADPDKIDAQYDLAMRSNSNKWEGEDEEDEVLVS